MQQMTNDKDEHEYTRIIVTFKSKFELYKQTKINHKNQDPSEYQKFWRLLEKKLVIIHQCIQIIR